VIEIDGGYHGERGAKDASRDAALARAGFSVVRFGASAVEGEIEEALARLRALLVGE
jgi:very-short-patch-repair endonuclease